MENETREIPTAVSQTQESVPKPSKKGRKLIILTACIIIIIGTSWTVIGKLINKKSAEPNYTKEPTSFIFPKYKLIKEYPKSFYAHSLAVGDLDNDGTNELIVGNLVLDNKLNTIFKLPEGYKHLVSDLNNDKNLEIITFTKTTNDHRPSKVKITITNSWNKETQSFISLDWIDAVTISDLNGNGSKEIIISNFFKSPIQVYGL